MIICRSSAKVNLTLDILSRRADGYHELRSVVHTVGLWDTMAFEPTHSGEFELRCDVPQLESDDNLCLKAARTWRQVAQPAHWRGTRITLQKNIPGGAGLGGGSGNAAATLLALNRLYDTRINDEKLQQLAATLGADVPLFLRGGCALMEGIGEKLSALPQIEGWVLVVQPGQLLSTPRVYKVWDELQIASQHGSESVLRALGQSEATNSVENLANLLPNRFLSNDLAAAAWACGVEVEEIAGILKNCGALAASMTGSGSAVFGVFAAQSEAEAGLQRLYKAPGIIHNLQYAAVAPFWRSGVEFPDSQASSA